MGRGSHGRGKQSNGRVRLFLLLHHWLTLRLGPLHSRSLCAKSSFPLLGSSSWIYTEWKQWRFFSLLLCNCIRILSLTMRSGIPRSHSLGILKKSPRFKFAKAAFNSGFSGRIGKASILNSLSLSECASWCISLWIKGSSMKQEFYCSMENPNQSLYMIQLWELQRNDNRLSEGIRSVILSWCLYNSRNWVAEKLRFLWSAGVSILALFLTLMLRIQTYKLQTP